jgi:hypothetical protein
MLARGFTGYDDFAEVARHVLVYERTSSGPYRPERLADCFHLESEEPRERSTLVPLPLSRQRD